MTSINISIKKWINYNQNVGVDALHMIGLPGTGKSNMATGLMQKCLQKGEMLVMPGDRFCEWKHYPIHPKFPTKLTLVVPKDIEIFYHPKEEDFKVHKEEADYEKLNVFDYLNEDRRLLVIYDQHLRLEHRTMLWVKVMDQLLNRTIHYMKPIGLLFHEAGILFPEYSIGDQWRGIKRFSELFVESRKGLVRTLFVSQIETELESTIRKKCLYQVFRKCRIGRAHDPPLRKAVPFTMLNEYNLCVGGLYTRNNNIAKFFEKKFIMKMIPPLSINGGENGDAEGKNFNQTEEAFSKLINYNLSRENNIAKLGRETGLSENTIRKYKSN